MRTFAISDIHGCNRTLSALLAQIDLQKKDELFLLGDYIDRGSGSKGVLDQILRMRAQGYQVHCLLGNHEAMLLHAYLQPESLEARSWVYYNGGENTLNSFGVQSVKDIPIKYIELVQSMDHYILKDKFIFVHAGLNFDKINPLSDRETMLWSFEDSPRINREWLKDRLIVHGHRIRTRTQIKANIERLESFPMLGIDNGCVYQKRGYHQLCALELNSMELSFHENIDV